MHVVDLARQSHAMAFYFKKMNVYEKVRKSECYKETGKAPIGVRWADVNKQDQKDPLYRSRSVAKDYNNSKEPDLCTATPPLEFLRLIVSLAASSQDKCERLWKIMVTDVSRACFYGPNLNPRSSRFAPKISSGETNTDVASCLYQCMARGQPQEIGRDAAQTFSRQTDSPHLHLRRVYFISPLEELWYSCTVTISCSGAELRWLEAALERKFEIKSKTIGHDVGDRTEVKILNRVISVTQQGFRYEPDLRHAELVVSELGLESAKSVSTPWTDACDSSSLLDAEHFKKYQSISARVNFLARDRMDIHSLRQKNARE